MTADKDYFFDWHKVEVHKDVKNTRQITIRVSGPCPNDECTATLLFEWTGNGFPVDKAPTFLPVNSCKKCKTDFSNRPLLPDRKSKARWWYLAKAQEREEIMECIRAEETKAPRKAEKKGKKRKNKKPWKPTADGWDFTG